MSWVAADKAQALIFQEGREEGTNIVRVSAVSQTRYVDGLLFNPHSSER